MNRDAVFKKAELKDPGLQQSSIFKFSKEIHGFRVAIHESGMLGNPYEDVPMRSIAPRPCKFVFPMQKKTIRHTKRIQKVNG